MGIIFFIVLALITAVGYILSKKKKLKTKSVYVPIITLAINFFIHRNNLDFYLTESFEYYIGAFFFTIFAVLFMCFDVIFEIRYKE